MGRRWFNMFMLMAGCLIFCFTLSCINDQPDKPVYGDDFPYTVAINFSTLNTRAGNSQVTEKIKSFRIIITSIPFQDVDGDSDNDGPPESGEIVQLNKYVTEENLASSFNYNLLWNTDKGIKNFYILANEESVGNLSYSNGITDETNLSTLLNNFTEGSEASGLKSILTSAYFTPDYTVDNSGDIYLPYTSIYEGIKVEKTIESYEMHIVPVATKFIFNFINYRATEVYINEISLNSTNTDNYLFANVGEQNMQMTLPGDPAYLYWVDWLAKVSQLSQGNDGFSLNQSFNTLYGWIWDYSLPNSNVNNPYVFVATENPIQIAGLSYSEDDGDEEEEDVVGVPGKYTAGPFYVPESRVNVDEPDESENCRQLQRYYLTIGLADSDPDNNDVPEFSEVEIDNLKALFRNTYVIINLVMRQGEVEIYAQIAPWTEQQSMGYVQEGNKPGFLNNSAGLRLLRNVVK